MNIISSLLLGTTAVIHIRYLFPAHRKQLKEACTKY